MNMEPSSREYLRDRSDDLCNHRRRNGSFAAEGIMAIWTTRAWRQTYSTYISEGEGL